MITETKSCQSCGAKFLPKKRTRRHCYDCDVKTREKAARQERTTSKACAQCGSKFSSTRSDSRFCSFECNVRFHTRKPFAAFKKPIACAECGTEFVPASKVNMTCSKKCARARSLRRGKEVKEPKDCKVCGSSFLPKRVLDVCCSPGCSDRHARKAQNKTLVCVSCNINFTHSTTGVPKRCPECRDEPKITAKKPCDYCGQNFTHALSEVPRFCSRACSAKGVNAEGISNGLNKEGVLESMVSFIRESRHTPSMEEIAEHAGVGENYHTVVFDMGVDGLFELAGRKNKSLFPSKFEERVYYCLLDLGVADEEITRQKKYPGLFVESQRWPLRYDFFIEHLNLLIEADGEQHSMDEHHLFNCKNIKSSDALKNAYAVEHGIELVRVPYSPTIKGVLKSVIKLTAPALGNQRSKAL